MATICEACGGTGCQTVRTMIVAYGEEPRHESPTRISCIWCNGTGHTSTGQQRELRDYRDAWCKCDPEVRRAMPIWNHSTARYDTICDTCKRFLVIG